jgi:hypothetical protein
MRVEFLLGRQTEWCLDFFNSILYTLGMINRNFILIIISFGRYFTLRNAPFFAGRYPTPKGFVSE